MSSLSLNTFARHGVLDDEDIAKRVAERLRDPHEIRRARAFPHQLLIAHRHVSDAVPAVIRRALHGAMEIATSNVPKLEGRVWVCPDVSGSMSSPVTGIRKGSSSKVRCVDVAALIAATLLRKNPELTVLPFETAVHEVKVSAHDSVLTNAERLAAVGGGGTSISVPLQQLNAQRALGDLVFYVSDNESWFDGARGRLGQGTATMAQWASFKQRNPGAKLVCLDIQPYGHSQAVDREDILNVGGFSDEVFGVVHAFHTSAGKQHWVDLIERVELPV